MSSLTLSVSEEIKREMEKFPEINWSAVAREAIKQKIAMLEKMNKLLAESELTEKETLAFGKKVTKKAAKKY
ncbi:hypothetical protein K8R43_04670 [archaeon]|nr:hypothetical protein [archaeon]